MKNGFFYSMLIMLSLTLMSSTCSTDDDDGGPNNNQNIAEIENTAEDGTWRITNFVDSGQNETNDFSGYNFTFASDGTLTATNGSNTLTGTWSVTDDSNSNDDDGSSNDDVDFNISFPVPDSNDFEDLNDDWDIVSYTSTTIELIDISGGNGDTDLLTFEKN